MERIKNTDVALIYELWDEYATAVSTGDAERWINLWIEDGIQLPPDAPSNIGVKKIRDANQSGFDQTDSEMTIHTDEVRVLGDRAYSHGTFEVAFTPKEGGDTTEANGKFLAILEKQVDGSWKIAVDCFNFDAPLG